jgi:hypothetical protein
MGVDSQNKNMRNYYYYALHCPRRLRLSDACQKFFRSITSQTIASSIERHNIDNKFLAVSIK